MCIKRSILITITSICCLLIGNYTLSAQEAYPDSLLRQIPTIETIINSPGGYTPQPITDSTLINIMKPMLGLPSPTVDYILQTDSISTIGNHNRQLLTYLLNIPLVIHYRDWQDSTYLLPQLKVDTIISLQDINKLYTKTIQMAKLPILYDYNFAQNVLDYLQRNDISLFDRGALYLAEFSNEPKLNTTNKGKEMVLPSHSVVHKDMIGTPSEQYLTKIKVKHWVPTFQSTIQFAQNYISDNWYKGGASNLNLFMRNYFALTYNKDNIQWQNEIESKLNTYNNNPSNFKQYNIADDRLRVASNFGLKAIKTLYYSIDGELQTQIFNTYNSDHTQLSAAFLSPLTLNIGIGMKFDWSYESPTTYGRNFTFSLNVAPLSYTFRGTRRKDIDLVAFDLSADHPLYHRFGSTVRSNWLWNITMNTSWQSRLYFNTSYSNVEVEWENTLNMAISKYFSTSIYLNLRYDDAVPPSLKWNKRLQINELLSFGFNYKFGGL